AAPLALITVKSLADVMLPVCAPVEPVSITTFKWLSGDIADAMSLELTLAPLAVAVNVFVVAVVVTLTFSVSLLEIDTLNPSNSRLSSPSSKGRKVRAGLARKNRRRKRRKKYRMGGLHNQVGCSRDRSGSGPPPQPLIRGCGGQVATVFPQTTSPGASSR